MDIFQSALLAEALEYDKEYQNLLNKQIEIIATTDFLKKLETPYKKTISGLMRYEENI